MKIAKFTFALIALVVGTSALAEQPASQQAFARVVSDYYDKSIGLNALQQALLVEPRGKALVNALGGNCKIEDWKMIVDHVDGSRIWLRQPEQPQGHTRFWLSNFPARGYPGIDKWPSHPLPGLVSALREGDTVVFSGELTRHTITGIGDAVYQDDSALMSDSISRPVFLVRLERLRRL